MVKGTGCRHVAVQEVAAGQQPAGGFERESLGIAAADVLRGFRRLVLGHAELTQRDFAEFERGFEGLADLHVDAGFDQLERVPAVVGAHQQLRLRELRLGERHDAVGGVALVDADQDRPRLAGARGPQHIEPAAVAVIDLEAELAGDADHLGVDVDDRDVDARAPAATGSPPGRSGRSR